MKAWLILEDGRVYQGESVGAEKKTVCEIVFNTSMTGYRELLTDPSYAGQGVVMTYPIIGSYGICMEDTESRKPWVEAYIVRELNRTQSNFRSEGSLREYLIQNNIPVIQGIDTRALTKHLRESGTMRGMITFGDSFDMEQCMSEIKAYSLPETVPTVTCPEKYFVKSKLGKYNVALLDLGCKRNILKSLVNLGCDVTVYPAGTTAEEILAAGHDGIMLSNGPGDPKQCGDVVEELKKIIAAKMPIFAICLGHQLVALASGFDTYKLKYGHRGANHPVKELKTGRVYITSQNHGYVVDEKSIDPEIAEMSYANVNDGSCEGVCYKNGHVFTVQFHPEACAGPHDAAQLFNQFFAMMGGKN